MVKQIPLQNSTEEQGEKLCDICDSIMILEDDKYFCPKCDGEINFFGEDDEDDAK